MGVGSLHGTGYSWPPFKSSLSAWAMMVAVHPRCRSIRCRIDDAAPVGRSMELVEPPIGAIDIGIEVSGGRQRPVGGLSFESLVEQGVVVEGHKRNAFTPLAAPRTDARQELDVMRVTVEFAEPPFRSIFNYPVEVEAKAQEVSSELGGVSRLGGEAADFDLNAVRSVGGRARRSWAITGRLLGYSPAIPAYCGEKSVAVSGGRGRSPCPAPSLVGIAP
jgi:hypothetical protein